MDDAEPPSLYIVASYEYSEPQRFSIIQLNTSVLEVEKAEPETPEQQLKNAKVVESISEIQLNPEPPYDGCDALVGWLVSRPTSTTEDLYMVPKWGFARDYHRTGIPLHGYKFNFTTGSSLPIKPPKPSKQDGFVVNLRGLIYFFGYEWGRDKHSVFQCYDPEKDSWSSLEPFPGDDALGPIVATAVWGDTILFNLDHRHICAYDAWRKEWYEVLVDDEMCYLIYGEAVVLEDTIYALDGFSDSVLSISIKKNQTDGEIVLIFSSANWVGPMNSSPDLSEKVFERTKHLVCLGQDNFCLVQSYDINSDFFDGYQYLFVTCIKVEENKLRIEKEFINKVKLTVTGKYCDPFFEQFQVLLGFSLPKCETTALKEGERFNFNLEPFPASIPVKKEEHEVVQMDKALTQLNIIDEEDDGCPIYVKESRLNATVGQCMGLEGFGPVEKLGIQVRINKEGRCFALVEFESATSERRAFAASPILIGDPSKILDMGLTLGRRNNRTLAESRSSLSENKFKNHVVVSRSKTTCAGHGGGPKGEKVGKLVSFFERNTVVGSSSKNDTNFGLQDAEESTKESSSFGKNNFQNHEVEPAIPGWAVNKFQEMEAELKRLNKQFSQRKKDRNVLKMFGVLCSRCLGSCGRSHVKVIDQEEKPKRAQEVL